MHVESHPTPLSSIAADAPTVHALRHYTLLSISEVKTATRLIRNNNIDLKTQPGHLTA
jgi:hypothetical protein